MVGDGDTVVGDGEPPSGTSTPKAKTEKEDAVEKAPADATEEVKPEVEAPRPSTELPTEVRVKLRKLDKLESRYQGESYVRLQRAVLTLRRATQGIPNRTCSCLVNRTL